MILQSFHKKAGLTALASILGLSILAERPDASLWTPVNDNPATVEYKGKDIRAKKAAEVLSHHKPDKYFSKYILLSKKLDNSSPEAFRIMADSVKGTVTVAASSGNGLLYGALSLYRPGACHDHSDAP